ncbi:hypothetical protein LXL04_036530 [Taraxacum kok-saghyz]
MKGRRKTARTHRKGGVRCVGRRQEQEIAGGRRAPATAVAVAVRRRWRAKATAGGNFATDLSTDMNFWKVRLPVRRSASSPFFSIEQASVASIQANSNGDDEVRRCVTMVRSLYRLTYRTRKPISISRTPNFSGEEIERKPLMVIGLFLSIQATQSEIERGDVFPTSSNGEGSEFAQIHLNLENAVQVFDEMQDLSVAAMLSVEGTLLPGRSSVEMEFNGLEQEALSHRGITVVSSVVPAQEVWNICMLVNCEYSLWNYSVVKLLRNCYELRRTYFAMDLLRNKSRSKFRSKFRNDPLGTRFFATEWFRSKFRNYSRLATEYHIFIQTGYPLDLPSESLGSYCIYEYHMMHIDNFRTDKHGVVLQHRDGFYSDDMTLAAIGSAHKRLIKSPPVAVFLHPLASDLTFSRLCTFALQNATQMKNLYADEGEFCAHD